MTNLMYVILGLVFAAYPSFFKIQEDNSKKPTKAGIIYIVLMLASIYWGYSDKKSSNGDMDALKNQYTSISERDSLKNTLDSVRFVLSKNENDSLKSAIQIIQLVMDRNSIANELDQKNRELQALEAKKLNILLQEKLNRKNENDSVYIHFSEAQLSLTGSTIIKSSDDTSKGRYKYFIENTGRTPIVIKAEELYICKMKNSEEYVFIDYKARLDEDTKIIKGISQWFLTEEFKISDFVNNVDTLFHYLRVDYYDAVTKKLKTLEEVNYWKPHHKEFIIGIKKNIKKIIIDMVREKNILATNTKVKSS